MSYSHTFQPKLKTVLTTLITMSCICNTLLAQIETPAFPEKSSTELASDPATRTIQQSIALMEHKQWQQALDLVNTLIAENKGTGVQTHGAKFATAYYYRGLCMLKLAQTSENETADDLFKASIQSFDQCYTINPLNDPSNIYRAKSLLLKGNAQQALKQYESAVSSYKQFLNERNTARDRYNLSEFNINLAICMWRNAAKQASPSSFSEDQQQEIQDAVTLIQQSLLHSGKHSPDSNALITSLNALSLISVSMNDDNIIPATIQKIYITIKENLNIARTLDAKSKENQSQLNQHLTDLSNLSKLILKTSIQNLPKTSQELTIIFPNIQKYATELNIDESPILQSLTNTKNYLSSHTLSQPQQKQLNQSIANVLRARAITLQESDNQDDKHSAVLLYKILVDEYQFNSEQDLYNLIYTATQSTHPSDTDLALERASQFLEIHPQSSLYKPVRTLYLSALYQNKQYQQALKLAKQILTEEDKSNTQNLNTNILQSASFIHGAAHYYLEEYTIADSLLAEHSSKYSINNPKSLYNSDISYLRASIQNQLLKWDISIPLLTAFIEQHTGPNNPTSIYTPFAYYDVAYALYSQGKPHSAILALKPFALDQILTLPGINPEDRAFSTSTLLNSQIAPSAATLLGNIHITLAQQDDAVKHYSNAIQLATQIGNVDTRDEAYYRIINTLGKRLWNGVRNDRLLETLTYYEEFIALPNSKSSPYYTQILTSSATALEKSNPEDPVYITLQKNLFLHNNTPNTPGIETNLKTYLYYLRKEKKSSEEIIQIIENRVTSTTSAYHQALRIVAKLETLEFDKRRILADGEINELALANINKQITLNYEDLVNTYRPEDLDNFTLLKIAKNLTNSNDQNNANPLEYFQAIIDSPSTIKQTEAYLGLALQKAKSNNPEERNSAKLEFQEIISKPYTKPESKATAHYNLIKLLLSEPQPEWGNIENHSIVYLKYPLRVKDNHLEILEILALAYDQQDKITPAISLYTQIWSSSLFSIQHSAPAIQRVCELLWKRNNPAKSGINDGKSDRQLAYETAYKYIRKTKEHFSKRKPALTKESINTWESVKVLAIKTYPQDSEIKAFKGQP